jgi:membrane protease YdiL (CAAX protease family)
MSSVPSYGSWLPPTAEDDGPPIPPAAGGGQAWRPWTAFGALFAAFALSLFGALLIGSVAAAFGASFEDPPPAVNIVATFVQDGAFVLAALVFAARAGAVRAAQFGLVRARIGRALKWSAIAYVAFWVLSAIWAAAIGLNEQDQLPDSLGADESTVALVAVCVLVTVAAPIAEELLFRGYMFGALRNWRGPWPAALITGVLFGAVHVFGQEAEFLLPLALLGVALCVIRWKTGSLLPCIALHAINNAVAFSVAESWTVGQGVLLVIGAATVTLLICRPFLGPREQRA